MVITIASGKGGTGKTTLAVNLAFSLAGRGEKVRLLDCDVEEPNDHLFLRRDFTEEKPVMVPKPVWDEEKCTACGKCAEICNYNAIAVVCEKVLIFNELCHSCGACAYICPEGAISEKQAVIGRVQSAPENEPFYFAHGILDIGESLAPNVVRSVKELIDPGAVNIIDASPGTACPVVEAVEGADAVMLVTEPTPFGLNDLKLAAGLALKMGVPTGIVVNRSDGEDRIIADYAKEIGLPITGRIPFSRQYAETYSRGEIIAEHFDDLRINLLDIFDNMLMAQPPGPPEDVFELKTGKQASFEPGDAESSKEVTVISGKGGTGKTTVVSALAQLAGNKILADNDVDAADLYLLVRPEVQEGHDFVGGRKARIESDKCIGCGECFKACHFNAIRLDGPGNELVKKTYRIDSMMCEGCGLCPLVCPHEAIAGEDNVVGRWYVSDTGFGPMVHACLGIAEENSGRLVTRVRSRAAELADELKKELILADGSPGTGCPVIASVSGTDLVVVVTEPTVSGVHDMERVMQLTDHFGVPSVIVINKADLNAQQAERIVQMAKKKGSEVIGGIPFDSQVNTALMEGRSIMEYPESAACRAIEELWIKLKEVIARM